MGSPLTLTGTGPSRSSTALAPSSTYGRYTRTRTAASPLRVMLGGVTSGGVPSGGGGEASSSTTIAGGGLGGSGGGERAKVIGGGGTGGAGPAESARAGKGQAKGMLAWKHGVQQVCCIPLAAPHNLSPAPAVPLCTVKALRLKTDWQSVA